MKALKFLAVALITAAMLQACSNPEGEKSETSEAKKAKNGEGITYTVNTDKSTVKWLGSKPGGEHWGYVPVIDGKLMVHEGEITGGKFTLRVADLTVEDLEDPEMNAKLAGHLKTPDFFNTEEYPEITFEISDIKPLDDKMTGDSMKLTHKISGNLNIKDNVKNISFDANVKMMDGKIEAKSPQFLIDRTEWEIMYGSTAKKQNLGDKFKDNVVHDDIGLTIKLHASK
ncbi:MAG: YceI family protein [Bacteroidales bacterium]